MQERYPVCRRSSIDRLESRFQSVRARLKAVLQPTKRGYSTSSFLEGRASATEPAVRAHQEFGIVCFLDFLVSGHSRCSGRFAADMVKPAALREERERVFVDDLANQSVVVTPAPHLEDEFGDSEGVAVPPVAGRVHHNALGFRTSRSCRRPGPACTW